MPQSHCAESAAERGRIDHLCSMGGLFLVILAMTMTMPINSNSALHFHVTSAGQNESFEHVQNFHAPNVNSFHSWLCALKTCSYLLCHTAYAPVPLSRIYSRTSTNGPFELVRGFIRGHSSPFLYIRVVFFLCV